MKKVVIGMSGGVDSSVACYLLKKQGYEVIGITFKLLDNFDCNPAIDTAEKLGIKHHVIDLVDIFKKEIINTFNNDYNNGLTPNPCVLCNRKIKFEYLEKARIEYNADYIATGHYAKIAGGHIYQSSDLNKDQSYFLSSIDKNLLDKIIFPLEGLTKDMVRKIAYDNNLPSASNKDSFDVCFIGNKKFKDYIKETLGSTPGDIIDVKSDKVIGTHEGLMNYTIGQRKNVGLSGNEERHYVCGKDINKNILYVAFGDSSYLYSSSCIISKLNLLVDKLPDTCECTFRYRGERYTVKPKVLENNEVEIIVDGLAKNVTPGQTCCLYDKDMCLGSGTITKIYKDNEELWYLK